ELQHRTLAVMFLEIVHLDLGRGGALLAPFAAPDLRTAQDRLRVDGVDADAGTRPLPRQAAGKMNFCNLCFATGGKT
ncbi:hypothetical protein AB9E32_34965, partial [Rhizobium leguminosarum]